VPWGDIHSVKGISFAHINLEKASVAKRQIKAARTPISYYLLNNNLESKIVMDEQYVSSPSYGSGILVYALCENSILGCDSLGEKNIRSEVVGRDAGNGLVKELDSLAPLDKYMGDQIIPFLAISGGEVVVSEVSSHLKTNVEVVNNFGFDLSIKGNNIRARKVF